MGAACCVASSSRDKTIQSGSRSTNEISHRNIRNSPTWSFRWDHRGRVAGEDTFINWFSDGISKNDGSENKNESALVSADGSPSHNCQRNRCGKSLISEGTVAHVRGSTSVSQCNPSEVLVTSADSWIRIVDGTEVVHKFKDKVLATNSKQGEKKFHTEEELKSVEGLQPASKCCKEIADYVIANSDPLLPSNKKNRRSRRFWKWLW